MRALNIFNLVVIAGMSLFTWSTVHAAEPMQVHLLQNVSAAESAEIDQALVKLGYKPTHKTLFSQSSNAIVITKVLKNEHESASLSIELVHLDNEKAIPRTLFQYSLAGNDIGAMLKAFPKPEAFSEPSFPVASTDAELP